MPGAYKALAELGIDHRPRKGGHGHQALDILPWAHTAFGNLKTWLRGTFHGVSPKHLQHHLDEFSYRFDRRWREDELFGFVLRRVVGSEPLPYRRLVADRTAYAENLLHAALPPMGVLDALLETRGRHAAAR